MNIAGTLNPYRIIVVFFKSRSHGFLLLLLDWKKIINPNIGIGAIWSRNRSRSALNCVDACMATANRRLDMPINIRRSFFIVEISVAQA